MKRTIWGCWAAWVLAPCCGLGLVGLEPASADEPRFKRIVIDADFPAGYQVEVADVNGDSQPDIIALGGGTCAWYENPTWTKRLITGPDQSPDIISSATADLDGDGKAEVAIAYDFSMNEPKRGKLGLAVQGKKPGDSWDFKHVADVGSIHRLRWGDIDGDGSLDLVVAPIFGRDATPPAYEGNAPLLIYRRAKTPDGTAWERAEAGAYPVMHAIAVRDTDGDDQADILAATNLGVILNRMTKQVAASTAEWSWDQRRLTPGGFGAAPQRGSSEVHLGRLKDGRRVLATINPWHGSEVAVCLEDLPRSLTFEPPTVIDDTLDAGHALWVADIDGDGDDEIFAGHRGTDHRVAVYDYNDISWTRTVIDREIAAQDLRGGDLDGDGTPDVVAIGGATHNVVWYRPIRKSTATARP